jgi:hypothetical protein
LEHFQPKFLFFEGFLGSYVLLAFLQNMGKRYAGIEQKDRGWQTHFIISQ